MPSPESSLNRRCVVIGAGLSGLAAAEVMINEGWHTTLVDAAGRALSLIHI